jgi:hypothetical protein
MPLCHTIHSAEGNSSGIRYAFTPSTPSPPSEPLLAVCRCPPCYSFLIRALRVCARVHGTVWGSDGIEKLAIVLKRRPPFVYATEANEHLTWAMRCNNYVQIVRDCRVAYYLGIVPSPPPLYMLPTSALRWLLTISLPASLPVCLSLCLKVPTPPSRRRIMPRACKHVCSLSTKLCSGIRHL